MVKMAKKTGSASKGKKRKTVHGAGKQTTRKRSSRKTPRSAKKQSKPSLKDAGYVVPQTKQGSEKDKKKVTAFFLFVAVTGVILALLLIDLFDLYSYWFTKQQYEATLKKFYYDNPLGIVQKSSLNIEAFKYAMALSGDELKQIMGVKDDFCIIVVDSNGVQLYSDDGTALVLCTDYSLKKEATGTFIESEN